MNPKWAEENLQTIRTLMERSAIYRRALAPIMIFAGVVGLIAAGAGIYSDAGKAVGSLRAFDSLWLATAVITIVGSLWITRRQAIKDGESFWSAPTRRVTQALVPPLLAGFCLSIIPLLGRADGEAALSSAIIWVLFYGLALHSAGSFMPRGIKFFGLIFIIFGCGLFYILSLGDRNLDFSPHLLMGVFFGAMHLAYGIYLYFTEKKNPVA